MPIISTQTKLLNIVTNKPNETNSIWAKLPKETRGSLLAVLSQILAKELQTVVTKRGNNYESEKSK